jgi:hypothetical protein
MLLWILLFVADRVFQSRFIERSNEISTDDDDPSTRRFEGDDLPKLWTLMPIVLACEAFAFAIIYVILRILSSTRNKDDRNNGLFAIDSHVLSCLMSSYVVSTAIVGILGSCMGLVVECRKEFRYHEDGARGIRALCVMLLPMAAIVIASTSAFC